MSARLMSEPVTVADDELAAAQVHVGAQLGCRRSRGWQELVGGPAGDANGEKEQQNQSLDGARTRMRDDSR
ncbi:MAG: hypothetical protein Q8P50_01720 [Bacillota bacterium]|nr:hypothetical protein [Bacillota bacterium]